MSNPELKIILDRANRTYLSGEQITGMVEVNVDAACHCQDLIVEPGWRTHGSGARDSGNEGGLALFRGTWLPGQACRYPFSFSAPGGPATYHGHHLNVDWHVQARASIRWAEQQSVEQKICLKPTPPNRAGDLPSLPVADPDLTDGTDPELDGATSDEAPGTEEIRAEIDAAFHAIVFGMLFLLALKAQLHVPDEAPITFATRHSKLAWKVSIGVSLDGSPGLALSYPITVRP